MKKLILLTITVVIGFAIYNYFQPSFEPPQFSDEENRIICIEEGI